MHLRVPEFLNEGGRNAWSTPVGNRLAYGFTLQPAASPWPLYVLPVLAL